MPHRIILYLPGTQQSSKCVVHCTGNLQFLLQRSDPPCPWVSQPRQQQHYTAAVQSMTVLSFFTTFKLLFTLIYIFTWFTFTHMLRVYVSRVPCTVFWGITVECVWPICTTGSALLLHGLASFVLASAQPCLSRSLPLCGFLTTLQTKFIASMRPSALTSRCDHCHIISNSLYKYYHLYVWPGNHSLFFFFLTS